MARSAETPTAMKLGFLPTVFAIIAALYFAHPDVGIMSDEELMLAVPKLPEDIKIAVRHNAGQHYKHSLYWEIRAPASKNAAKPTGRLADAIISTFGGYIVNWPRVAERCDQAGKA